MGYESKQTKNPGMVEDEDWMPCAFTRPITVRAQDEIPARRKQKKRAAVGPERWRRRFLLTLQNPSSAGVTVGIIPTAYALLRGDLAFAPAKFHEFFHDWTDRFFVPVEVKR